MYIQPPLRSRSTIETNSHGSSQDIATSTIVLIVVGVVCLLVLLIGFYLVSRPRAAPNAAPSVPSPHSQHSAITRPPRPRRERDISEHWRIWKIWHHTHSTNTPATVDIPTLQVSTAITPVTSPSEMRPPSRDSKTPPPTDARPSQARRVTSLSVTTSFSHSHITQEDLNNFRLSAYDLDDDLETEMLNSARDDVWPGHALAVEGYGVMGMEEAMEAPGNAASEVEGSVPGYAPARFAAQWRGGDYENVSACHNVASDENGVGGDAMEGNGVTAGDEH